MVFFNTTCRPRGRMVMVGAWWLVSTSLQPPPQPVSPPMSNQIANIPGKIVPWEGKVQKEKNEREEMEQKEKEKVQKEKKEWEEKEKKKKKEKEKEREWRPTLAALMEERLLASMLVNEMGVPLEAPPPRLSAYREADRVKIRPFQG